MDRNIFQNYVTPADNTAAVMIREQPRRNGFFGDLLGSSLDMVVPHARRDPLNPMAYVKDFNEWFAPSAQMALDELNGSEEYPAWVYALASAPVVGKPVKAVAKKVAKSSKGFSKYLSKEEKLKNILESNPMNDDYHTGVRSVDDVLNFDEARKYTLEDIGDVSSFPDVSEELLDEAAKTGKIKLYSSRPFSLGSFVSPSKMQAADYAGKGPIYEDLFDINDIAWLNADEGQIARISKGTK